MVFPKIKPGLQFHLLLKMLVIKPTLLNWSKKTGKYFNRQLEQIKRGPDYFRGFFTIKYLQKNKKIVKYSMLFEI